MDLTRTHSLICDRSIYDDILIIMQQPFKVKKKTKNELIELIERSGLKVLECDVAPVFGQTGWDTLLIAVGEKIK